MRKKKQFFVKNNTNNDVKKRFYIINFKNNNDNYVWQFKILDNYISSCKLLLDHSLNNDQKVIRIQKLYDSEEDSYKEG